jgi:hypothetical protein
MSRRDFPQVKMTPPMSLSFDPDAVSLPIGHFIGERLTREVLFAVRNFALTGRKSKSVLIGL